MKINKTAAGFEALNLTLNISIIMFMWSVSHFYCTLLTGLFAAKFLYLHIYQYVQMTRIIEQRRIMNEQLKNTVIPPENVGMNVGVNPDNVTSITPKKDVH